jgi:hypothetical protein
MNCYLAKIVFRIICGEGKHIPQFDEQFRLIYAEDDFHAFQKARQIGEKEEDNFLNEVKKMVRWKFVDVCELRELNELTDGVELHSEIHEYESAEAEIYIIKERSKHLHDVCLQKSFLMN